ncbi:MAG: hypothetical protein WA208_13935 [Thermoanaerobaculia bacterium]
MLLGGFKTTPMEALTLGFDAVYVLAETGLDPLALSAAAWAATHPAQAYDFSQTHTYSDQDLSRLDVGVDARYLLTNGFWVNAQYRHAKLDDNDPYIIDVTGRGDFVSVAVGRRF